MYFIVKIRVIVFEKKIHCSILVCVVAFESECNIFNIFYSVSVQDS